MLDYGKRNVLGVRIDALDYESAVKRITDAAKAKQAYGVSALASHGVMTGFDDPEHRFRLNSLELVTPDGQPVRWALNWLYGLGMEDRVAGPVLTLKVLAAAAAQGLPVYFYGSSQKVLDALAARMTSAYPGLKIAGMEPSKFRQLNADEQAEVIARIKASGASMVFVGLGCPRQEVWVFENREALSMPALAVGAAFDFHAGLLPRAPEWMARNGLEWSFRLLKEPKRLWRRYLILGSRFLVATGKQGLGISAFPTDNAPKPIDQVRYG
jgi:exopolysaccharide biosynthesis WecB/TagA/CpsF family protein